MPVYSYVCPTHQVFEVVTSIKNYKPVVKCPQCSKKCQRDIVGDAETLVHGGDSTPKTLGSLADKQTSNMGDEQKRELWKKHNAYRYEGEPSKELPAGMERIQRPEEREYWT